MGGWEEAIVWQERAKRAEEALRQIRGWRELRDGPEFPVARVEEIADEVLDRLAPTYTD